MSNAIYLHKEPSLGSTYLTDLQRNLYDIQEAARKERLDIIYTTALKDISHWEDYRAYYTLSIESEFLNDEFTLLVKTIEDLICYQFDFSEVGKLFSKGLQNIYIVDSNTYIKSGPDLIIAIGKFLKSKAKKDARNLKDIAEIRMADLPF